ncbi:MAG: glycosyltransferase [Chroococcus sp. CMT-3BRIN-NPC107]|jgi:glycosyltransferase involved in cell wall biosynthesis/SAM-dependent methyltransferase|nr:glycosyltransferase [Chroococcus sp. CMT-3BRIN-NPC107]
MTHDSALPEPVISRKQPEGQVIFDDTSYLPLVSVIMPFLNPGKYIKAAVESVFAQTYDNWELLLIDDGSTDISTQIALDCAERYPNQIRYLEHEGHQNRGTSATRNLGISKAQGEYIALLDADDIWLAPKLAKQVAILNALPEVAMVYNSTLMWYSWTGNPQDIQYDRQRKLGVRPDSLIEPPTLLTLLLKNEAETPGTCSILVRREIVNEVGGFEDSFRGMYDDQVFLAKIWLKASVFVESGYWDRYRQHPASTCHVAAAMGEYNPLGQPNSSHLAFLKWLEQYLVTQNIQEQEVWDALKAALAAYQQPNLSEISNPFLNQGKQVNQTLKSIVKQILPAAFQNKLRAQWQGSQYCPPPGEVQFGNLRRTTPISRNFGYDRGSPVDRYYIERFLTLQAAHIQGRVLEVGDRHYTLKFGGDRVTHSDVLHITDDNPQATIVADLAANPTSIPSDAFDCIVLTQTMQMIYDVRAAVQTVYRILKPGGVALVTLPGVSYVSVDRWKDYWHWAFTTLSTAKLFEEVFPQKNLQIESYGNVLSTTAFLQGMAAEELQVPELDYQDPNYLLIITVIATKPE